MSPSGNGRHCGHCQKIVVDFSVMSTPEIQKYFLEHQGHKTCGHFKASQVNEVRPKLQYRLISLLKSSNTALADRFLREVPLFLLGLIMTAIGCQPQTVVEKGKQQGDTSKPIQDTIKPTVEREYIGAVLTVPSNTVNNHRSKQK